jgi:hypothetical protein
LTGPAGTNGTNGTDGVGYTGVTSTSSVPVAVGLHTWTVSNVGAFLPGMRIRAIHTDTPSIWLEGFANVASGSTIIITADKLSGSGTHNTWKFAVAGEIGPAGATGATGATGPTGVVTATAPITYDSGTQTVGLDLTNIAQLNTGNAFTGSQTITSTATGSAALTVSAITGTTVSPVTFFLGATLLGQLTTGGTFHVAGSITAGSSTGGVSARLGVVVGTSTQIGAVIKAAASQTANLLEFQPSGSTTPVARVSATGGVYGTNLRTLNDAVLFADENSGGYMRLTRQSTTAASPGSNIGKLYFRDGTNAGTLKLVVRAGASGAETTILDNIPQ